MTSPSEKHIEAARNIMDDSCLPIWAYENGIVQTMERAVTDALAHAEREGMRRAAEIARDEGAKSPGSVLIPAVSSVISDRILSEIGDET